MGAIMLLQFFRSAIAHPCLFTLVRDLVDAGVLVAPVIAVKPTVAGIVVRHTSAGISTGSKLEALTKLGVSFSTAELIRFTTATTYGRKCDNDHVQKRS